MNRYIIIAGVNGTGKSSLRGVLEGQEVLLGHIIDADAIAKMNNYDNIKAGKKAVEEIKYCLDKPLFQDTEPRKQFSRHENRATMLLCTM